MLISARHAQEVVALYRVISVYLFDSPPYRWSDSEYTFPRVVSGHHLLEIVVELLDYEIWLVAIPYTLGSL